MSCEVASWVPNAVAATLRADRTAQPILAWLTTLRASIEEYDPLIIVTPPHSYSEESDVSSASPDSAFDEILSQLGKEIFKLDQYQHNLVPEEKEVSLSILNIFDECLDQMTEEKSAEMTVPVQNGMENCSSSESTLSDASLVTSTPTQCDKVIVNEKCARTRLKSSSTSSSIYDNVELIDDSTLEWTKLIESDSDSESTCWSYKECSDAENEVNRDTYAAVWSHSSGFHNSDEILRRVLSQNRATVSRLSFDTVAELEPANYTIYALHDAQVPVGDSRDRCVDNVAPVMTPDRPSDDGGYEPVRDAITDENIYEEIEYGYSYTDEGCSCGTSVEVESCSISASSVEGIGRESPLYANLRDHDAYAITPDVIFWKNLLLDPFYNDDEEDEWITPEECEVYTREQRPPLVIPRITQYRAVRMRQQNNSPYAEDSPVKSSMRQYERLNWSPTSEKSHLELERSFGKASPDSQFSKLNKRLGGSTEHLSNTRRPQHLPLPASSSGDSLDVEMREKEVGHARSRKSRSMVAPKHRMRSPVPAPRMLKPQPLAEAIVLGAGQVKRTKFFEGGKKSRKNWTDCFMTLTVTALRFYKDQRTFHAYNATKALRAPGTPPSPTATGAELVLPLHNAWIEPCSSNHTRRHSRSLVLRVDHDQYLIQDETDEGAKWWLQTIQNAIHKLLSTTLADSPVPQKHQSSNTDIESIGRTPPPSRPSKSKQKAGGSSNEDLSDSTDKSHIKNRLRKLFARRTPLEVLMKQGIYKDEPVFGQSLEAVCPREGDPHDGLRVPAFVRACVDMIESSDENMCTDGLYRASGNLSQVQRIRLDIDQNKQNVIENNIDIHVLTGSLKLFFRELKQPLIPYEVFEDILAACSIKPKEAKIKKFRKIIQSLPECNRHTLKFLLVHLLKVTKHSEKNRMHTANLAIVFGPTLLWAPADKAHNIAVDCIQQNNVVDILLNEFDEIFAEENKAAKKKA